MTTRDPGDEAVPIPDLHLVERVTGARDLDWFHESGRRTVEDFEAALATVGATLSGHRRILDFGCGCGRAERWMRDLGAEVELHGVDVDAEAIAWSRGNLPWARFRTVAGWPPLPYPDGYFDLVLNHSVFSHLDATYQDAWLDELRRVAAPNARLHLSVHGDHAFELFCAGLSVSGRDVTALRADRTSRGLVFLDDDGQAETFPDFYHLAFHTHRYIAEHWRGYFEVCQILERRALDYQDVVILRRRPSRS